MFSTHCQWKLFMRQCMKRRPSGVTGAHLACTDLQLCNRCAHIDSILLGHLPNLLQASIKVKLCPVVAAAGCNSTACTSLILLSSSSSGFSKSRTVGLGVFSLTGPKRDRIVSSHSLLPDLLSLGASGGVWGFLLDCATRRFVRAALLIVRISCRDSLLEDARRLLPSSDSTWLRPSSEAMATSPVAVTPAAVSNCSRCKASDNPPSYHVRDWYQAIANAD